MRAPGLFHLPRFIDADGIAWFLSAARAINGLAPFVTPTMPDGRPLHLKVTNAGAWGWWADAKGYRYVDKHPTTGQPWPPIPPALLTVCSLALDDVGLPQMRVDNMLINFYEDDGSLGLHVDRSERDREAPIVSVSVGSDALFLMGGPDRRDKTEKIVLSSGDVLVQSGLSRGWFHGIDKLLPTLTSPLKRGRLNFTFRKVMP